MAFLEDPRLRQRWNQISHNAGEVTENAAAGIWSFQHHYINPCLASLATSLEQCANPCLGDREERARRKRERDRAGGRAEYSFDFYDDWYAEDQDGGFLGGWGNDDWDRLLAGTGSQPRKNTGEVQDQPKRKRGMSYGTRGRGSKALESDPTVIPSTQPIGFLGKLPWKLGKTLRYKPSAADLQDHPRQHDEVGMGETEPLLANDSDDDVFQSRTAKTRNRSGTTGSGVSSDSYRSRGDLFPSDGEGEEDAVPLDDEFMVLDKVRDDRSSSRTKGSKGKRRADGRPMSRTVSRATIDSSHSMLSPSVRRSSTSGPTTPDTPVAPSMEASMQELQMEEERIRREEDDEVERKRQAALQLASERGLHDAGSEGPTSEGKSDAKVDEVGDMSDAPTHRSPPLSTHGDDAPLIRSTTQEQYIRTEEFVPARLPSFR
ncbi:hypothetical protein CORC01_01909 [Colletotrichum orchidophilum]|uniref:Uncharacterized protein n=1 Tax=Colletotrichum orchidophilum TaxID=1209926 RepID=A0A1G4BNC3_9PEZI|nr:uncharacterized protein CORC01_01909 [Colletotrichum orchidophilum]OHF02808.1 hypothetical protein CORC01_01909 [Colletotrichum orchidophilum]